MNKDTDAGFRFRWHRRGHSGCVTHHRCAAWAPKFATNFIPLGARGRHPAIFPVRPIPDDSSLHTPAASASRLLMSRAAVLVGLAVVCLVVTAIAAEWTSRVRAGIASMRRSSTLRTLGADEHMALAPVRALTGCDHDDQVKRLHGAFTGGAWRNSFPVGDGFLGGIPVLVPRQAWPYLAEDNEADVVLGDHVAMVVRLNGFSIAAARPDAATSRVCGERLETPEEVSMRRGRPAPVPAADCRTGAVGRHRRPGPARHAVARHRRSCGLAGLPSPQRPCDSAARAAGTRAPARVPAYCPDITGVVAGQ
ncbi:protein of unknown function [Stenotrophomonas maltophilia]|nr:protein of unknown function [Stenotrophomonas maltophilia]